SIFLRISPTALTHCPQHRCVPFNSTFVSAPKAAPDVKTSAPITSKCSNFMSRPLCVDIRPARGVAPHGEPDRDRAPPRDYASKHACRGAEPLAHLTLPEQRNTGLKNQFALCRYRTGVYLSPELKVRGMLRPHLFWENDVMQRLLVGGLVLIALTSG